MIHDEELLEINLVWWEWIMEDVKSQAKEATADWIPQWYCGRITIIS